MLSVVSVIILIRFRALRPGGLNAGGSGSGGRDVKPIPAIMWLFAAFVTFFGLLTGGKAAQSISFLDAEAMQDESVRLAVSFGVAAVFGIGLLFFVAEKAPRSGVKPGWADPGLGVCIFLLIYPLVALSALIALWIARGVGAAGQDRLAHETLQMIGQHKDDPWVWLLIGVLVLIVPLVEELIYRVFLQSALLRAVRSRWLGAARGREVRGRAAVCALGLDGGGVRADRPAGRADHDARPVQRPEPRARVHDRSDGLSRPRRG